MCGVTRYGYGHAETKDWSDAGSRIKELIGDALRNAGMRFGCALELWHKGDLHLDPDAEKPLTITPAQAAGLSLALKDAGGDEAAFLGYFKIESMNDLPAVDHAKAITMIKAKANRNAV